MIDRAGMAERHPSLFAAAVVLCSKSGLYSLQTRGVKDASRRALSPAWPKHALKDACGKDLLTGGRECRWAD